MRVEVFDKDRITRDDSLGVASVSLLDLRKTREKVVEAELSTKGSVSLLVTWTAHGETPPVDPALMKRGRIHVQLKSAAGLKAADLNGKSDPYAVLTLCGKQHKSATVSKTLTPTWNETFEWEGTLGDLTSESLRVEVFDKDRITRDDSLGIATIPLLDLRTRREKDVDATLSVQGTVVLHVEWVPHAPSTTGTSSRTNPSAGSRVDDRMLLKRSQADLAAKGMMEIKLLAASGLIAADANGLSDPYVVFKLGNVTHRSRVVPKSLNPNFNDEIFQFHGVLGDLISQRLLLEVFDKDTFSRNDSLGKAEIDLASKPLLHEEEMDIMLSTQGHVSLRIAWKPNDPSSPTSSKLMLASSSMSAPSTDVTPHRATGPQPIAVDKAPPTDLSQEGSLRIELQRATNLKSADSNGLSDPYVVLSFLGKKFKSKVVPKSLNPHWNESFPLFNGTLGELTSKPCLLEVFDRDRFTRDESLGKAPVDLTHVREREEQDLEVALPTQGVVYLHVTWSPTIK